MLLTRVSRRKFIRSATITGLFLPLVNQLRAHPQTVSRVPVRDFAEARWRNEWLQHAVLGGPSFDSFERIPANPIWRGSPPLEWPVNGFLFIDPVSTDLFVYIGAYTKGYISKPSSCIGMRSRDKGKTWEHLGTILAPDPLLFDKGGHTPDVCVVYEKTDSNDRSPGVYHMIYDWGEVDFNKEGGLGYARASKPEGPWIRDPNPITRNTTLPLMKGRYRRTYAATLIKRKNDWLITGMMDDAPHSWTLFVMTAARPEGPYSERKLVRDVRANYYHPPLLEFFPSFVHDGYLYAPATSVARNRNYGVLFRVPLEKATDENKWELYQDGSLWHAADKESEYEGLWGQTFSGQVDAKNVLWAMFPSRDSDNLGTIHVAKRYWDKPFRERGFVLNAHSGPALTLIRSAYGAFEIEVRVKLNGTARLVWDYEGVLGPETATSDSLVGKGADCAYCALEISDKRWEIVSFDTNGKRKLEVGEEWVPESDRRFMLRRNEVGNILLRIDDDIAWRGSLGNVQGKAKVSQIGWWLEPRTHLEVLEFKISGSASPAKFWFDATDALLGAGERAAEWKEYTEGFRSAKGYSTVKKEHMAKWNVRGRRFTLWSPKGPEFGSVELLINGVPKAKINLNARKLTPSKALWVSDFFPEGGYAIILKPSRGAMVVDCLEVEQ